MNVYTDWILDFKFERKSLTSGMKMMTALKLRSVEPGSNLLALATSSRSYWWTRGLPHVHTSRGGVVGAKSKQNRSVFGG